VVLSGSQYLDVCVLGKTFAKAFEWPSFAFLSKICSGALNILGFVGNSKLIEETSASFTQDLYRTASRMLEGYINLNFHDRFTEHPFDCSEIVLVKGRKRSCPLGFQRGRVELETCYLLTCVCRMCQIWQTRRIIRF